MTRLITRHILSLSHNLQLLQLLMNRYFTNRFLGIGLGILLCNSVQVEGSSSTCQLVLERVAVPFSPTKTALAPPQIPTEVKIVPPGVLEDVIKTALAATDKALSKGEIAAGNSEAYRARMQQEIAKARLEYHLKDLVDRGAINPKNPEAMNSARKKLEDFYLQGDLRESILFVDTPVVDTKGKPINRPGAILVVDHHGPYAPKNPLNNSGAQIIERLKRAALKNNGNTNAALADFQSDLFGKMPKRILLSADNLADAAEVLAILKNQELQRRIIEDPTLADMLIESGRFTDFFVFSGDAYEKTNINNKQSQLAIALSKAIMHSHSEHLKKYQIQLGDRIVGINSKNKQQKLLQEATDAAERLMLEVTSANFLRNETFGEVGKLARNFDAARGSPTDKPTGAGKTTSFDDAKIKHKNFTRGLSKTLMEQLLKKAKMVMTTNEAQTMAKEMAKRLNEVIFGHEPVSTGHQFADWAASAMANAYSDNFRPIKFEIGGKPNDVGKLAIIAKSGPVNVNLTSIAANLNKLERIRYKEHLMRKGTSEDAAGKEAELREAFTTRGTDLVFSFGGHFLTRGEIEFIVAQSIFENINSILPK